MKRISFLIICFVLYSFFKNVYAQSTQNKILSIKQESVSDDFLSETEYLISKEMIIQVWHRTENKYINLTNIKYTLYDIENDRFCHIDTEIKNAFCQDSLGGFRLLESYNYKKPKINALQYLGQPAIEIVSSESTYEPKNPFSNDSYSIKHIYSSLDIIHRYLDESRFGILEFFNLKQTHAPHNFEMEIEMKSNRNGSLFKHRKITSIEEQAFPKKLFKRIKKAKVQPFEVLRARIRNRK
ncbi:MAG: hypothetical protein AAFO07_25980 [Bacteroidota bacterium]